MAILICTKMTVIYRVVSLIRAALHLKSDVVYHTKTAKAGDHRPKHCLAICRVGPKLATGVKHTHFDDVITDGHSVPPHSLSL